MEASKTCTKCLHEKPLTEFYRNKNGKDGLTWACKLCIKTVIREYGIAHPEIIKARQHEWSRRPETLAKGRARHKANAAKWNTRRKARRLAHLEEEKATNRAYRLAHLPEENIRRAQWRKENPKKVKACIHASGQRRRAQKAEAALNDLSTAQIQEIIQASGYRCSYCGKRFPARKLTVDHITPFAAGGDNTLHNVTVACRSCNSKKFTGPPPKPVQPLLLTLARSRPRTSYAKKERSG